ncbi:MAG: hypothetical protein CMC07_01400 [Flavobacteriaceae bacterium]|nr:hypothetical protein [Flavobacteriaceae bacterium]
MFNNFFCVNYEIITKVFRNKDYPFLSTILSLVIYQFFTVLFIIDFITFQILKRRDIIMEREITYGIILISLLIISNYVFFSHNNRSMKIWNEYLNYNKSKRMKYRLFSYILMITIIILNVFAVYSLRNNIYWF